MRLQRALQRPLEREHNSKPWTLKLPYFCNRNQDGWDIKEQAALLNNKKYEGQVITIFVLVV